MEFDVFFVQAIPPPGADRRGVAAACLGRDAGRPAGANAPQQGAGVAPWNRVTLGGFEVTKLLAGSRPVENPQTIFGLNASAEDFKAVADAAFLPVDKTQFFFTPTPVETGTKLML